MSLYPLSYKQIIHKPKSCEKQNQIKQLEKVFIISKKSVQYPVLLTGLKNHLTNS